VARVDYLLEPLRLLAPDMGAYMNEGCPALSRPFSLSLSTLIPNPSLRCLALLTSPRQIRTSGTGSTSSGEATTSVSSRSSEPLTLMTCCGVIRVLVMSGGGRSVISCVGCNAMGMLFIFVRMLPVDIGFTKVYVTRYKSGLWSVEPGDSAESLLLAAWPGVKTSSVPHRLPC
jgi:hypothetical protein